MRLIQVLWDRGPSTVREVHEAAGEGAAYTTTLKLLQIMHEKGLVERDESERAHVYRAAVAREATQRRLIADLAKRAFGGSTADLVMRALADRTATDEELEQVAELLDRLERDRRGGA